MIIYLLGFLDFVVEFLNYCYRSLPVSLQWYQSHPASFLIWIGRIYLICGSSRLDLLLVGSGNLGPGRFDRSVFGG